MVAQKGIGLESLETPVSTVYAPLKEIENKILYYLKNNEKVLGVYENAWLNYRNLLEKVEELGANPFAYYPMDPVEFSLASNAIPPKDLLVSKISMITASKPERAPSGYSIKKRVSRRSLLMNPLGSVLKYYNAPFITGSDKCIAHQGCTACIDACPKNALNGKPPEVNPAQCDSCSICLWKCPHNLLNMPSLENNPYNYLIENLARRARRSLTIIVVEKKTVAGLLEKLVVEKDRLTPIVLVPVESVDHYTEFHLIEALSAGFSVAILARDSRFWRSEYAERLGMLPLYLATSEDELIHALSRIYEAGRIRELNRQIPSNKILKVKALAEIYAVNTIAFRAPVIGYVSVDEDRCLLCDACSSVCPTQALNLKINDDRISLVFLHDRCTACGECVRACQYSAITLKHVYDAHAIGEELSLAEDAVARCKRCGKPIGSLRMIRHVESILKRKGVPKWVLDQIWLCPSCKIYGLSKLNE